MSANATTAEGMVSDTSSTAAGASTTNWAPNAKVTVGILAASLTTLMLPVFKSLVGRPLEASGEPLNPSKVPLEVPASR